MPIWGESLASLQDVCAGRNQPKLAVVSLVPVGPLAPEHDEADDGTYEKGDRNRESIGDLHCPGISGSTWGSRGPVPMINEFLIFEHKLWKVSNVKLYRNQGVRREFRSTQLKVFVAIRTA